MLGALILGRRGVLRHISKKEYFDFPQNSCDSEEEATVLTTRTEQDFWGDDFKGKVDVLGLCTLS